MITLTLRPIHLAVIAGFLAGIIVAGVVVLGSGSGDAENPITADSGTTIVPTATMAPTLEPTTAPPTPEPTIPPEPQPPNTPIPTTTPEFRSCEEIRQAGTYNSEEERQYFLDNCITTAPTQAAPADPGASPAPPTSNATAQEALYRDRGQGNLNVFGVKLSQYANTPALGGLADILEIGAVMRRQAQDLDRLPKPPPRFMQVHDQYRASLLSFADFVVTVVDLDLSDAGDVTAWLNAYGEGIDAILFAVEDYALVVGLDLPPELAP